MAMTSRLWSISALAVELDMDRRTVANCLRNVPGDGKVRGKPAWRLTTVLAAIKVERGAAAARCDSIQDAERRKMVAQAELAEMKVDVARGELLPAAEVVAGWQAAIGRTRGLLLGIASGAPPDLVQAVHEHPGRPDLAERDIRAKLRAQIDSALTELQHTQVDEIGADEPDEQAAPAP